MQGYITLATGHKKYLDMAVNLCLSLKKYDPKRPVALLYDSALEQHTDDLAHFDDLVLINPPDKYIGCMLKMCVYDYTPYEESMFVDADCVMVRTGIDKYWDKMQNYSFNLAGDMEQNGKWYNMNIAEVIEHFKIPFVVKMNSGVFFFKKNDEAKDFFKTVSSLVDNYADMLTTIHQGRIGQLADEPFLGVAMGIHNITPIKKIGNDALMISTWRTSDYKRDSNGGYTLKKHSNFLLNLPFLPLKKTQHSPVFMHFINLKPIKIYNSLCKEIRNEVK